jgi:hypothetical protein
VLKNLTITGFRTFRELHVDRLTRVNLFVGTNNAGKTSILEAAEVLTTGEIHGLLEGPSRRGEEIWARDDKEQGVKKEIDPSHLFHGHDLKPDTSFSISADGDIKRFVHCEVSLSLEKELESANLFVHLKSHFMDTRFPISPSGGLQIRFRAISLVPSPPVNFLGSEAVKRDLLGELWDEVVLEPEEEGVTEALRIIDPRIERIAFIGDSPRASRNIYLKLADSEQRLPLGSMGDGLKRLLSLALHLFSARGGFLLVDEIDTGLHHTVMVNMWKLVIETARRLDVQVFATSHSLDCVHALAWVREQNPDLASDVSLHRVEKGATKTVAFTSDELLVAARNHLELR